MERKIISAETKAEILRELLENQVPAAELCERYQVNINSVYNWRKQLFESASDVFRGTHQKHSQKDHAAMVALQEKLRDKDAIIAELAEDNIALKKIEWHELNGLWVEPDVRDAIVRYVAMITTRTHIPLKRVLAWLGIKKNKYHQWRTRVGEPNKHNGKILRATWILPWERDAIIAYRRTHSTEGYRCMTYMMLDDNVVAVSPSTTYRVLKSAGLLSRWNVAKPLKKRGFDQPERPHEHWHVDIKYVNFHGTFLFLISVIDGFSRYIVHHELRVSMQEYDVQLTIERALNFFPGVAPRIISDNGTQFIAKDFTEFMRLKGLQHVRTSIAHPQSNGKLERFHATISSECLHTTSFLDLEDARRRIAEYIACYNTKRLHSAIYYLTPQDVLEGRTLDRLHDREQKLEQAERQRRLMRQAA